ncbi:protein LURP-one-related 5 isoform X1 [Arachis hypogaea]|uniref:Protein LURP-one-related n=1 Tax=Arachis hypogaea TaxID=3818 RepID=A0A6B9V2X3_ARAHY|nr:protein LURP-one-related 5 isoform X1 [Arachis hypogaea]QHN75657.1 Protein LURP-one-related [Arachis hypogaea]
MKEEFVVQEEYVSGEERNLTVLKTSRFFAGDGFTVYDCKGQLVFRVDSYGPDARDKDELVLMDPQGRCLLTVKRKRPSLHQRWEGFKGERIDGDKALFSMKRTSLIGRSRASVIVEVYDKPGVEYHIEGCFSQRCCKIYNAAKKLMAEIRRKVDSTTSVMLGKEVFSLYVKPGFDGALAMGLVLVLDQINGTDEIQLQRFNHYFLNVRNEIERQLQFQCLNWGFISSDFN